MSIWKGGIWLSSRSSNTGNEENAGNALLDSASIGDLVEGGVYAGILSIGGIDNHIILGLASSESSPLAYSASGDNALGSDSRIDGLQNTQAMISAPGSYPGAEYCESYINEGFDDWYLPSLEELQFINNQLPSHDELSSIRSSSDRYWTSTSYITNKAYRYTFSSPNDETAYTNTWSYKVRPIRRVAVN